jgi:hypothetical protein
LDVSNSTQMRNSRCVYITSLTLMNKSLEYPSIYHPSSYSYQSSSTRGRHNIATLTMMELYSFRYPLSHSYHYYRGYSESHPLNYDRSSLMSSSTTFAFPIRSRFSI